MARDALDPGDGSYPWWPRDGQGRPIPIGRTEKRRRSRSPGRRGRSPAGEDFDVLDTVPRHPDGRPVVEDVPTIPPGGP